MDDNRKRSFAEGDDLDAAISSKRAALGSAVSADGTSSQQYYLKMLCPGTITGSIIGRGGSVINEMNASTGAKIRISQNSEFYPTTNERVLVIAGSQDSVSLAIAELVRRIIETPDRKPQHEEANQYDIYGNIVPTQPTNPRANQIRLLIPIGAAGVMIGRAGSVIKSMSEETSCHMQLAPTDNDPYQTKERIMIINSKSLATLIQGVQRAAAQLYTDPVLCIYANTRTAYAVAPPGAPSLSGTGGGYPGSQGQGQGQGYQGQGQGGGGMHGQRHGSGGGRHQQQQYQQQQLGMHGGMGGGMQGMHMQLIGGLGPQGMMSLVPTMTAISAGPVGVAQGLLTSSGGVGQGQGQGQDMNQQQGGGGAMIQVQGMPQGVFQASNPYGAPQMQQPQVMLSGGGGGGMPQPGHSYQQSAAFEYPGAAVATMAVMASAPQEFSNPTFSSDGTNVIMQMGVSDGMIGSILGRGGSVVKEIKNMTGADVQVSQKDAYLPGTKQRSVTVKGLQHQVNAAQGLIVQKLMQHQQQQAMGNMARGGGGGGGR